MTLDEIIKKQKEHLTKAQVKQLANLSERYKQLNAAGRADAYNSLHRGLSATRRGLQNIGLASRRGHLISGQEQEAELSAQEAYGDYSAQANRVASAYTQRAAAQMANETMVQQYLADAKKEQAAYDKQEAAEHKAYEKALAEYKKKRAAALRKYKKALEEYKRQLAAQKAGQGVVNVWNTVAQARNNAIVANAGKYAVANVKNAITNAKNHENVQKVNDALEKANNFANAIKNIKKPKTLESAAKEMTSQAWNTVSQAKIAAMQVSYDTKLPEWQNTIKEGAAARQMNPRDTASRMERDEAVRKEERARKEMAKAQSDIARYRVSSKVSPTIGEKVVLPDDEFDVRYDAAVKAYENALHRERGTRGDNWIAAESDAYSMQPSAHPAAEKELERATTELAYFEYAKKLRTMYSAMGYFYDSIAPSKAAKKYEGSSTEGVYTDPRSKTYDKEHGTEGSKYAAIINELSKELPYNKRAYQYTFRGKLDFDNDGYREFESRVVAAYGDKIAPDAKTVSAQYDRVRAAMIAASYMTQNEKDRYNTILADYGVKKADEYFDYLYETVLVDRVAQAIDEDYDATLRRTTKYDDNGNRIGAEDGKMTWLAQATTSALSIPVNLIEGLVDPISTMINRQSDPVTARLEAIRGNSAQNMRNAVQENFGEWGRFFYGTGMSMADSATVALISGGIGKVLQGAGVGAKLAAKAGSLIGGELLGGSAFNSAYADALDKGLSPDKARQTAVGQGINEMLFESLSLDLLVGQFKHGGVLKVSKNGFVNWIVNTLVQGGVEGSEEVFTDMANNLWDKEINGIYSEELTKLREYISQGMSYEEAKRKVNAEFAEQLGMSFLGGFVSGGVMGGGASFLGMLQGQDVAKIGRNLDDAAKAEIRSFEFQNAEAKEILTGKLTDEDYGRLAMTRLEEMAQTDPVAAEKAAQSLIDATARTDVKVDKRNQTLKTGTENSVSFDYDGVTDVKKMSGVQVEALRFAQTLVKSKVGGVNINVANQLYDKNGNEQNGWYDPKTNTVHVSLNGSQSVVYTISHELTHRLKEGNKEAYASLRDAMKSELESLDLLGSDLPEEYSDILGDYLVKDGVQLTAWEALIDYEMDRYAKHGIKLDREAAEEEVVCRACETMLEKSRLISSMVSRNVRGAKKIAKLLASISDDIEALKAEAESRGYEDGSPEKMFVDQYTNIEKIANAWAAAMKTVSQEETKKIVKEEGRGGTAFSLKQELRDDGQSLADKSMKYRKAHKAESQHISDEMLEAANKQIHRMAQRMLPFLTLKNKKGMTYLPDEVLGKTRFGNSSYGGTSIENTTICFRTLAYIDFTNEIKKQIGRPLTVSESFLASQMLYQIAKEPQCLYCYVSLDRKAYDEQLLSYINQRDKVVEAYNNLSLDERQAITNATRNASKAFTADIPLYTEFLAGRKDTVPMRTRFAQWIDIANSGSEAITAADLATDERRGLMRNGDDWQETKRTTGKVSLQDQVIDAERYAQGASWAKKMEEYRAYNGDILSIGKKTVNKLNHEYGLRFYSFSEYSPAFIVENMQQIRDAALKGLMGLAYTKKTDFARIFAGTGMNINVSTFGRWGVDADGNRVVVMDSDQGADWTEVQNLRKQYENVGAVFVATDDAMTEWAIKQDWIDVVIPFHIVRTGANVAEFYKWVVHNSEQNDVTAEGKNATIPAAEHGNSYEKYMSLVNERGLTPRFDKWRPENNPNVTADEYMKLVNETRRTLDATKPLQPIYDTREAAKSFGAFVHDGGYYGDYYKAKSEQDIKVPISPAQDILGIGSKTYTEQEGIDRVVADIKAGNKANQVPYGRQDIDEQISRLNKARQMKQHGQKFSIKESDAQYMDLARRYESGDKSVESELRKQVDAAAKAAGYKYKGYHGTNASFTVFDPNKRGSKNFMAGSAYLGFFASKSRNTAEAYTGLNSFDYVSLALGGESAKNMEEIKTKRGFDERQKSVDDAKVKFEELYKSEHGYKEEVTDIVKQVVERAKELNYDANQIDMLEKVVSEQEEIEWNKKHLQDMYNAWYETNEYKEFKQYEESVAKEWEETEIKRRGYTPNVKELYIKMNNPFIYDFNGEERDTDSFAARMAKAQKEGYDGCIFLNVADGAEIDDIYTVFDNKQFKSADLITKDDNGNIIPLSERFKTDRTGEEAWKNEDIRYSIRGRNALYSEIGTLDSTKLRDKQGKENLNIAYKMDREGIDSEKIRLATGWFKGYDGKWRNEIDDSGAKLADWIVLGKGIRYMEEKARKTAFDLYDKIDSLENRLKKSNKVNGADSEQSKALRKELRKTRKQREEAVDFSNSIAINRIKLSDILDHAKLYENYPQLKDVTVQLDYSDRTGYLGSASGTTDIIITTDRNSKEEILQTLMHEVQHIIQGIEGFAKGANVEYWADRNMRESADLKDAKATLAQVERDLSSVKYEGNPQASPLKTAVSYAYITDQLRKDKPGTANYAYDTEQKEKYEKRAEEAGYADLLKKYLIAYQAVNVAKMEAKDYNKAFADYQRTAGEVEARDVASRLRMSEDERKATRPDIDRKDVTFFEDDNLYNERSMYSIKDDVRLSTDRATLAGQMHEGAKGARALREQSERYNERIEELNGRIGKLNKRIAELKTQMEDASLAERMHQGAEDAAVLRKVRDEYNERIAQRDRLLEQVRKQRDAAKQHAVEVRKQERAARVRRDIVAVLKRGNDRIVKLLAKPTENAHVPVQLARAVSEYAMRLNDLLTKSEPKTGEFAGMEKQTQKGALNAQKILDAYRRSFADEETIALAKAENPKYDPRGLLPTSEYDEQLVKMIEAMDSVIQVKRMSDLTTDELRLVMNTMRGVIHAVTDANKLIGTNENKTIWKAGDQMVEQLENAPSVSQKIRGYLETSLDLRRLAKIFSGSNENAEFVKLVDQLNKGAIEKERIAQTLQNIFKPVTDKYGDEIRKWYGKNAEWIDTGIDKNGHAIKITKGMRVSLAMHVLNSDNMRHIENGGLSIPNKEMYRKGNLADAYANGELVRMNRQQIFDIISHMTEAEKAYVEAAMELFHKRTGYFINKTSLALLGYRKAMIEKYFPIHTDKNFTKTDFASLKQDGTIEGQGFLKERVNASNPVYLEDITSVVNRQIRGVALYAGLAIPMRNFNAVMNASIYEDDNGVWSPRTTVKQTLTQKMGEYGAKVVKGFLEDTSEMTHVDVTPMERFAGKLATNYVKAVLLGNLKVAMKQVASYPTAAAVIPWKYLGKALIKGGRNGRVISRADVDLINQYTPLYQMRREGNANEIASIMAKRGMEQKLPWLLGWITKMDVMTVGRLWSAAEYMVADQQSLPVGSDEYYKAVAKVFNDTIQQTQPNFTPLQRNAALRSKNPVVRSLVLFGTQRMQNGGILIEAAMELKQSKGKSKAEIKAAKMKLGRAVASQIVQNILLIVASLGVDALRGRMKSWQDEDKDITPESMMNGMSDMFLSNFIGSFLGGSETYSLISGLFKKAMGETAYDTEFTVPALDAVETLINFAQSDVPDAVKYLLGDHTDEEKQKKAINFSYQLAKAFGYATGIPLENALKDLFKGIIPAIKDLQDWKKTGELNLWLHQSGKLDKKTTNANYKEWTSNGFKGSEYFYWENVLTAYGKRDEKIPILLEADLPNEKKAMLLRMMDKSGATSDGTVVYKSNGDVLIDFANPTEKQQALPMPTAETEETATPTTTPTATPKPTENPLTDARQDGVREAVAKGVPEQTAFDAFIAYQNMGKNKSDDYSRNDDFRAWLFANVTSPEQRAVLEYQVIGTAKKVEGSVTYRDSGVVYRDYTNESWFKLSEHNLAKDGTNKRYEAGKRLEKTGLSVDKTVAIYDGLTQYTKKAEWKSYLKKQGLSDEQINIFLWSRGWAKLK